jgi:hypothetical protein
LEKVKVKLCLWLIKRYVGLKVELNTLALAVNGEQWLDTRFGHFILEKKPPVPTEQKEHFVGPRGV